MKKEKMLRDMPRSKKSIYMLQKIFVGIFLLVISFNFVHAAAPVINITPLSGSYVTHQVVNFGYDAGSVYYCRGAGCDPDILYVGNESAADDVLYRVGSAVMLNQMGDIYITADTVLRYKGVNGAEETPIMTANYLITGANQSINFTNGKWETTFSGANCPNEWSWVVSTDPNCDSLHAS